MVKRWGMVAIGVAAGFVLGVVVGGAITTSPEGEEQAATAQETPQETPSPSPSPSPSPTPTLEPADPDARYSESCDYVLGDFTDRSPSGYRFVAQSRVENTGNVGVTVEVTATWQQLGTRPIRETKTVNINEGRAKVVRFTYLASQDEIDLHQSADSECDVTATIVGHG